MGAAVVAAVAEAGASVVIDHVGASTAADAAVASLMSAGHRAIAVEADVSRPEDLTRLVAAAVEEFGRLDVMVNNAGIETRHALLDTTEQDYDAVLGVNLKGAFFGTQAAAHQFIAQGGGGVVINISSVHEDWPMPGNTAYCVSKGGMRMLTRTAGVELGPHGIRVVGVAPGAVDTPINASTESDPVKMRALDAAIPLGRVAEPAAIGSVVAFLASDAARYVTATTVVADGGLMQSSLGL
ncbi:SDR family oxidoreductase [Isoptericola sp. b441]|uniref:SDR family oxidoreductase n=1 Tax=Actinotalea lenta TaxID=3064654 RepID=A0ABT9D7L6_9CELL|nr:SDR family oxidoreductase [Isoptericola sp. b441]MDO8106852.1 SDR family oxidoreductase [Isoptericola sp. b441]